MFSDVSLPLLSKFPHPLHMELLLLVLCIHQEFMYKETGIMFYTKGSILFKLLYTSKCLLILEIYAFYSCIVLHSVVQP